MELTSDGDQVDADLRFSYGQTLGDERHHSPFLNGTQSDRRVEEEKST